MTRAWPADKVERKPLAGLLPYARNARTHSDAQIEQIAASVRQWGWTVPVLTDEAGLIIAGHGRVLAAARLGLGEVPVIVAHGWSEAQKNAYRIADNQLALNGGWSLDLLKSEMGELARLDFDLGLLGFDERILASLSGTGGLTDPDEAPEAPAVPITQAGDVWQLGRHRLTCGDATNAEDVARVLGDARPHLMVTDPPYGIDYNPDWRNQADRANGKFNSDRAIDRPLNDNCADWRNAWTLFSGDVVYCWSSGRFVPESILALEHAKFERRCLIIWAKSQLIFGRGHYHNQEEECWYAVRKGRTAHWQNDRTQSTLWQIDRPVKSETGHSTQKPVECMKRPIENNSAGGDAVYDPFVGSGTTIIAAEMTGRACHAIEISPAYCDVSIERWQNFTGEKARRA